jgi:hypothetical protein
MIDIKTVLVPVDFSEASKKAAKYGLTLAAQLNAKLVLAHIVPDVTALTYSVPPESYALQQQQREAAGRSIQSIIPPEFVKKFDVETIVKLGDVETELLQTVKDTKPISLSWARTAGVIQAGGFWDRSRSTSSGKSPCRWLPCLMWRRMRSRSNSDWWPCDACCLRRT